MATPNSFVQVNNATSLGKKLATYEFLEGADVVESEAVTLTDSDGNELLGQKVMAGSVPVVFASDQSPIPVAVTPLASGTGTLTKIPATNAVGGVGFLAADATRLGFSVFNQTPTDLIYLLLGTGVPSPTNFTVILQPNAYFEGPFNYTGPVSGIWGSVGVGAQACVNVYTA